MRIVALALAGIVMSSGSSGLAAPAMQTPSPEPAGAPIFVFDHPFWLNLHHFLYVLGRAEAKTADSERRAVANAPADQAAGLAALDEGEQRAWRAAVSFYARGPSRKDAIFDGEMVEWGRRLVAAGDRPALDSVGLEATMVDTLRRAAPLYRKAWWTGHDRANRAAIERLTTLVTRDGPAVRDFVVRAYGEPWPASGYPVHIAAYANWAGAFSTSAGVLVVSSLDEGLEGLNGLEMIFHEAMHQWDDAVFALLAAEGRRQGVAVPDLLSHAMIFYTVGHAVRSIRPEHVPYAESAGVWNRGMAPFKPALDAVWRPYLDGRSTRGEAMAALVKAVRGNPR